jgi:hypothetical protein
MTSDDSPVNRDYVRYLQAKLVEAEAGLLEMGQKYGAAKASFDLLCARRGIGPEADMVSYQELKGLHPELEFWYSKVEHFQREMAAYGAALTGIEAARRLLGSDVNRRLQPDGRRGNRGSSNPTRTARGDRSARL